MCDFGLGLYVSFLFLFVSICRRGECRTDLAVVGAASAFDCFMACKHKSSCRFFTFDLENSLCHLKPVSALRSRRADAESVLFVSGSRHATPKQQTPNKTCCCGGKK